MLTHIAPSWTDLNQRERALVTFLLRTAEGEGTEYAWENYRSRWPQGSPLAKVETGNALREAYGRDYEDLSYEEFWKLYDEGEANRR